MEAVLDAPPALDPPSATDADTLPDIDAALRALLASPLLPRHLEALNEAMRAEQKRRERFYEEMTEQQKVEFINGEVVMQSPAKWRHTKSSGLLLTLLLSYVNRHQLGEVSFEKTLVVLTRNDYEPDVLFFGPEKADQLTLDQMKFPAPDFVVEVLSPSTAKYDRGIKKQDYAAHGVGEYWIIDSVAQAIEQYLLDGRTYHLAGIWNDEQEITSTAVAGFRIPVRAIFDTETHLETLDSFAVEKARG